MVGRILSGFSRGGGSQGTASGGVVGGRRRFAHGRLRPVVVGVVVAAVVLSGGRAASAQQTIRATIGRREVEDRSRAKNFVAVLHPSEEAGTLLSRARQGIEREDWKLVVDALQRIVELPGEHVLTSDGRVYESARRHAHRQIAALPAAGLAAYRLMYDSEAAALMAQAAEQHDTALLRDVIERYLVTKAGDDAGVMLAGWLMDEGRFAEAVAVLQLVQSIYPDSDLPRWTIASHLAVCYASMGRRQRAEAALAEATTTQPSESEAGAAPGVRWAERRERIRAYLERPVQGEDMAEVAAWPLAYGRAARDGIMPAVEPTLAEQVPWVVPLGLPAALSGVDQYALERKLLPTASMVVEGRTLVVKAGPVLMALDVDTFDVMWRRESGSGADESVIVDEQGRQLGGWQGMDTQAREPGDAFGDQPDARRLLHDSVGSGVTVAGGLVLTVEWRDQPPGEAQLLDPRFAALGVNAGFTPTQPNRIVAYRLEDGKPAWESSARPGESKLASVEYLSAPVPVGGQLLAPCRVNTDLYAAVLDPANGRIVRSIYLCGTGGGPFDSLYALVPCVADGVVYIPTGRGVIIALEAASWTIRWAVRYDELSEQKTEGRWLSTPVIAVADAVLLAPADADYLYGLDRATGEIRWHVPRGDSQYVLGATDRHVWLGGEQTQLLNVETGERVWTKSVGAVTGRGVVSGERVYLPTRKGLVALEALTGKALDIAQPADPPALGNLLAFNHTLYSTDVVATREFPDMQRGYAEALARYQRAPADAAVAVRLARLELLRHAPAKALAVLEQLPATLKGATPRRQGQVSHLAVTAMLELAGSGTVSSDESRRLLEKARRTALLPQDAMDSALALGEYHRREHRPVEACLQYLSLALSLEGDQMIQEGEGFQQRARSAAVRRLADAAKSLSPEQRARLDEALRAALVRASAQRDGKEILWLAESPALGVVAFEAELLLGAWAAQDLRFEQAEGHLRRVLRQGPSPALRAEAAARLAALYVLPDELHQPVNAVKLLDALEREYAGEQVPADVLADVGDLTASRPAGSETRLSGADVARALRRRIDRQILARHEAALSPIAVGAVREPVAATLGDTRPLLVRDGRIEPLADQQLVLSDGNNPRVEARRLNEEQVLWPAELKLLNEMAVASRVEELNSSARLYRSASSGAGPARALADGQTLIVNSAYGIHAIGLLTGRRLWSRRFDPPAVRGREPAGSDAWLWVHDGYVISVDRFGQLEVARTTSGDRLLWACTRPGRHWYAVRARGPYVVAVDEKLEQADVYRLEDGRYLGRCQFKQDPKGPVNLLMFDDVICGPAAGDQIVALELATPGVERWRVRTDASLAQIFKPSAELLAVSDRRGGVQLIDPATGGARMPDVTVRACEDGVTDGTLAGGVLYVCGYKKRRSADEPPRWGLAALRVQDRSLLWSKDDLGAWTSLNQDVLECATNVIPLAGLVVEGRSQSLSANTPRATSTTKVSLSLVDKATGNRVGQVIEVPLDSEAGSSRALSLAVHPGQVQVTVGAARWRFPFAPVSVPGEARPASRPDGGSESPAGLDAGKRAEARTP